MQFTYFRSGSGDHYAQDSNGFWFDVWDPGQMTPISESDVPDGLEKIDW